MRHAGAAIAVGLTLCLAAGGFAAPPLYVAGIGLVLIGTVALTWVDLAARDARVVRSVGGAIVEEGSDLPIEVSVARGRIPVPGGELRAWPGDAPHAVPTAARATRRAVVRFARRGRHRLGPASLVIADPLGLSSRTIDSQVDELLVLPRVEPVQMAEVAGEASTLGRRVLVTADAGTSDVDSLRPHRPGMPASRIHWPTVARTRTLMERSLTADGDPAPLVVVDPRAPSSPAALDQAVRAAASLCVHLARRGGCALLLPGDRKPVRIEPGLRAFAEAHARLAVLAPEDGAPTLAAVGDPSVVLWVSAAQGAAPLPAALRSGLRYLVSPHPRAGWPVEFTVAGCAGQRHGVKPPLSRPTRTAA